MTTTTTTTRRTIDVASVDLAGGRRFEATMYRSGDGAATDLVLAVDYSSEPRSWRDRAGCLAIPPDALPEIIAALAALNQTGR